MGILRRRDASAETLHARGGGGGGGGGGALGRPVRRGDPAHFRAPGALQGRGGRGRGDRLGGTGRRREGPAVRRPLRRADELPRRGRRLHRRQGRTHVHRLGQGVGGGRAS